MKYLHKTIWIILFVIAMIGLMTCVHASKISELMDVDRHTHAIRFFRLEDPSVRFALLGSILIGISCGLLGSFMVVRKMSLVGDALSHAVLPGVALAFMWKMTKDPLVIFVGAIGAGLVGTILVQWISQTTHLKNDSILGMVLSGLYALGVCLLTIVQRMPIGNKSGLSSFLFGQAAAISEQDIFLMAVVTLLALALIFIFYKELLVISFDGLYAQSLGMKVSFFQYMLTLLLSFAVVISLQAVGVVLVSAMLITPAATAYLITDRFHKMLGVACGVGVIAGILGAFISFLGNNLPTGPFIVVAATLIFIITFFMGPRHGLILRWWRHYQRSKRVRLENDLKAIFQILENHGFLRDEIGFKEFCAVRKERKRILRKRLKAMKRLNWVEWRQIGKKKRDSKICLTQTGWSRVLEIVRNHRLWELYLANEAQYQVDHVHEDAEKIEHILDADQVAELEKCLNFPQLDPHGKPIPSAEEISVGHLPPRLSGHISRRTTTPYN